MILLEILEGITLKKQKAPHFDKNYCPWIKFQSEFSILSTPNIQLNGRYNVHLIKEKQLFLEYICEIRTFLKRIIEANDGRT